MCVLSRDSTDCGPAALATVAAHWGIKISVSSLKRLSRTTAHGTTLEHLRVAAGMIGLEATWGRAKPAALETIPLPAIVHLSDTSAGHFAVLQRVRADQCVLADPSCGILSVRRREFAKRWTRHVLLLRPATPPTSPLARSEPSVPRWTVSLALKIASGEWVRTGGAILLGWAGLAAVLGGIVPVAIAFGTSPNTITFTVGAAAVAGALVHKVCEYWRTRLLAGVAEKWERRALLEAARSTLRRHARALRETAGGDLITHLGDVSRIREVVVNAIDRGTDAVLVACATSIAALLDPLAGLMLAVHAVLVAATGCLGTRVLQWVTRREVLHQSRLQNVVMETLGADDMAYAYRRRTLYRRCAAELRETTDAMSARGGTAWKRSCLIGGIRSVSSAAVAIGGSAAVGLELMSAAHFVGVLGGVWWLHDPCDRLGAGLAAWRDAEPCVERLRGWKPTTSTEASRAPRRGPASMDVRDVALAANDNEARQEPINFRLQAGESTVVSGTNGTGKTTLVRILCGMRAAAQGEVLIGGVRLSDRPVTEDEVGVVFEETTLLNGSVLDNILMGAGEVPGERVEHVARMVGLQDVVGGLPGNYSCDLTTYGSRLSFSQRQRLGLARALVRKPDVLILDEPLKGVDVGEAEYILRTIVSARKACGKITVLAAKPAGLKAGIRRVVELGQGVGDVRGTGSRGERRAETGTGGVWKWRPRWPNKPAGKPRAIPTPGAVGTPRG